MSLNFSNNLAEIARNGGFTLFDENQSGNDIKIDWRFIAAIDIHRIIHESNFEKLDECIPFLIKSSLSNLFNTRILDPAIAKIFSLSQIGLQYLLFCTRFLDKSVLSLRENLYSYQKLNLELQEKLKDRENEIDVLKKKTKKAELKKLEIFPCTNCTKNFESKKLLDNHMLRKHRELKSKDSELINTIKLELEIKQLKEKLNATEKELMDAKVQECEKCLQNENRVFKNIGIQINYEEKEKDDLMEKEETAEKLKEINEHVQNLMDEQMKKFHEYKETNEKRHTEEISELKAMLDKAMKTIKEHEIKQNEIPLPAPRSAIAVQVNDESASIKLLNENENLWKIRFQELGEMYEKNQIQMAQSMKDLEKAYVEKMNRLEESVKQFREEKPIVPVRKAIEKEIIPRVYIKKPKSDSSSDDDEIIVDKRHIKIVKKEPQSKIIQHQTFSDQKFSISDKKKKKIFSAQKWFVRNPENIQEMATPKRENENIKEKTEKLLTDRMNQFGIDSNTNTIRVGHIENIQSELANRRETSLKNHPYFFINRKKIKAKVEEMFKSYTTIHNDEEIEEKVVTNIDPVVKKGNFQLEHKTKKKVLFNLNNDKNSNKYFTSYDDSDFDLTSLEDDMK